MFSKNVQTAIISLFFFMAGCGPGNPTSGHDPNKPLPIVISDSIAVLVNHATGAIITTPDGKAVLAINETTLNADTFIKISPYNSSPGSPVIGIDQMYSFEPEMVSTLNSGQIFMVKLRYDPRLVPAAIQENDLRLGLLDIANHCWKRVFLDSPAVIPGVTLHEVTSRDSSPLGLTQLGVFGVTSINTHTCPNPPQIF